MTLHVREGVLPFTGLTKLLMHPANPLSGNVPYFIISLCLMPDDFTLTLSNARGHQGESHS